MQQFRSMRWLMPALLLSLIPMLSNAGVLPGMGFALHVLPVLGQAATAADAAPAAQQQAPEKAPANRKHLNVSVGPLRMHLPISGKRPVAAAATAANGANNGGSRADVRVETTNTGAQKAGAPQQPRTPAPGTTPQQQGLSTAPIAGIAGGVATQRETLIQQPSSEDNSKPFTIKGDDQQAYQPPQGIDPANGSRRDEYTHKPIRFRWTPVIPKPQEPVTYRVTVWQLMQGQTGAQAMKANQPIITKDVDEQGRINPAIEEGRSMTAPGLGTGKPQPADNPITAINITLPANPDANVKVNGTTVSSGTASSMSKNKVVEIHEKQSPEESAVKPSTGNGNHPTQQPGVVRGNIFGDGGANRTAAGHRGTEQTHNPNGKAAETFTVTNAGGSPTSSLDTRPPKAQQPGQERGVINKGLPITNKNIEPTERPKFPHETATPSSATPISIEHDPAGMAAPGTTPGGPAPPAKPAKKKSKIGIHVVF